MARATEPADRGKHRSRGWSHEMDGHAISRRLAIVEELYSTWRALKTARKIPTPSVTPGTMPDDEPSHGV